MKRIVTVTVVLTLALTILGCPLPAQVTVTDTYVAASTSTTATIVWTTSGPATSQILYGFDSTLPYSNSVDRTLATSHSMTLTVLQPDRLYYFAVVSVDGSGHVTQSATSNFSLCSASSAPLISAQGTVNNYYQYGSFTMTWVPPAGSSGSPTACGQAFNTTVTGPLSGGASLSASVGDSYKAVPGPGSWHISVTDAGNLSPVSINYPLATQSADISALLQAQAATAGLTAVITNTLTQTVYPPYIGGGGGGGAAFSAITGGTNASAAMLVGSGASLGFTGSGILNASEINGVVVTGTPGLGKVLTGTSSSAADWELPSSAVSSVTNSDGTLTIFPTTGVVVASLALGHANTWTATQTLSALTLSSITGSTQCLHVNSSGVASGTGFDCGSAAFSGITGGTNATAAMLVGSGASLGPTGTGTIQATNIAGTVAQGTNVTISGAGTVASPYVITSSNTAATAFSALTGSTNTTAAMVVGAGASLNFTSSGTINASSVGGVALSGLCQTGGTGCPQPAVTKALVTHQFFTSYTSSTGVFTAAQPAFTDLSGTLGTTQGPSSLTGMLYDTAGTLSVATAANIISLWTGTCSSVTYLRGDGVCAGGSSAFSALTGSTNTTAAMLVGTGASLGTTGSGTIAATTAANLTGTPALPNGTTATTQTLADNSTKLATDAFVLANAVTHTTTALTILHVMIGNGSGDAKVDTGCTTDGGGNMTCGSQTTNGTGSSKVQIGPNLFSALPACVSGTLGTIATVTDSTTNTWGATITGGGSNTVLGFCDGGTYTVVGK